MIGDTASARASNARGSTPLSFAVPITVYIAAARSPTGSEPANSHAWRPRAIPRRARSAPLFERQIRPPSRRRVKGGPEHVIDCFGDVGVT
jgi:hypothetical protein